MSPVEIGWRLAAAIIVGYLLGSIPSGVLVSRLVGKGDPRAAGSGKTGATNVLRTLGRGPAAVVVVVDVLKGVAAVLLVRYVFFGALGGAHAGSMNAQTFALIRDSLEALAALAAVLGHNYSIFIRFTGGRGVLTGAGALVTMSPLATLFGFVAAVTPIYLTRYVSLGSLMGAVLSILTDLTLAILHLDSWPHFAFILVGGAFVIISHKDNIERLRNGTERKLGEPAHETAQPAAK
ncbi:MAG: glycerol-3-phosphate 1-O-acyltransferase PlsY [Ktedonobacterales bacterium]